MAKELNPFSFSLQRNAMKCCKSAEWIRYIAIYLGLPSKCDRWLAGYLPIYSQKVASTSAETQTEWKSESVNDQPTNAVAARDANAYENLYVFSFALFSIYRQTFSIWVKI